VNEVGDHLTPEDFERLPEVIRTLELLYEAHRGAAQVVDFGQPAHSAEDIAAGFVDEIGELADPVTLGDNSIENLIVVARQYYREQQEALQAEQAQPAAALQHAYAGAGPAVKQEEGHGPG
jgi:hypothetical protein